jgi:hypothetical protein
MGDEGGGKKIRVEERWMMRRARNRGERHETIPKLR